MKNGKKSTFNSENKKKEKKNTSTRIHITSPRQAITKENGKINLEKKYSHCAHLCVCI